MKICILNQKGGSAKTSTSVLSSMAIASRDYKVLAVDCDPQAGLTRSLANIKPEKTLFNLLMGDKELNVIKINRSGIVFDLIPSSHKLDKIYASLDLYEMERVFKDLKGYDYIVFDCPPTVQGITRASAFIADKIFIPADISRATIEPTLYTIESLKDIKKTGKVILIGYKEPDPESKSFTAELSRDFIKRLGKHYAGTIPRSITMQKAVSDNDMKWTPARKDKILKPILKLLGVE